MKLGGKFGAKLAGRRPLAPDPEVIRALAGLLAETGLSEIEYAVGDHRIRLARETAGKPLLVANGHAAPVPPEPPAAAPANGTANGAVPEDALTSPIVGIAYLAPQPGAAPFVKLGDRVGEGDTVLIIEAMKVMNQIRAPRGGRVARIFIDDAQPVEYGQPLLLIE
ncbi:MAG TPA: acetyl-CoA carboxylase biotin carboxyl carrier protein subunit [Stellaceae bacterium]|nr:acetyl-CoA carboxylase biotin carboxyl carrier protein subunit [Stellaceae bacterium]